MKTLWFTLILMISSQSFAQSYFKFGMDNKCSAVRNTCLQHLKAGCKKSGIYRVLREDGAVAKTYCDQVTSGGGWTLVTYNRGTVPINGSTGMDRYIFVSVRNAELLNNNPATFPANSTASINAEKYSIKHNTKDAMLVSLFYSTTPLIDVNIGNWNYNTPKCSGILNHSGRNAGCPGQNANDDYQSADMYNIAIGQQGIVPYYREAGFELCYSGGGQCNFDFYLR